MLFFPGPHEPADDAEDEARLLDRSRTVEERVS